MTTVSIQKCRTYDNAELTSTLTEAVKLLGGFSHFVKRQDKVLLKPNFVFAEVAEKGSTTHPAFLLAVARLVKDCGAIPVVVDSPGFGSVRQVIRKLGIEAELSSLGIAFSELKRNRIVSTSNLNLAKGIEFERISISADVFEADVIINLPKLKAHSQLLVTGAVKNLYGLVKGKRKAWRHFCSRGHLDKFARMLIANTLMCKPALTILDGVLAMERTGPRRGDMRNLGLIVAGDNPIAVDRVVADVIGLDPMRWTILRAAKELGAQGWDIESIQLLGEPIENVRVDDFRLPTTLTDIGFDIPRMIKSAARHQLRKLELIGG